MNKNIALNVLLNICDGYVDTIMTGLEEEKDRLIYTRTLVDFINNIGNCRVNEIFVDTFLDKVSKEITMYLAR